MIASASAGSFGTLLLTNDQHPVSSYPRTKAAFGETAPGRGSVRVGTGSQLQPSSLSTASRSYYFPSSHLIFGCNEIYMLGCPR